MNRRTDLALPQRTNPARLYERICIALFVVALVASPFRMTQQPSIDHRGWEVCFVFVIFEVYCWRQAEPQPCPTPTPTCDPSTQSCP